MTAAFVGGAIGGFAGLVLILGLVGLKGYTAKPSTAVTVAAADGFINPPQESNNNIVKSIEP